MINGRTAMLLALVVAIVMAIAMLILSASEGIDSALKTFSIAQIESNGSLGSDAGVWYSTRMLQQDGSWSLINASNTSTSFTLGQSVNGANVQASVTMINLPTTVVLTPASLSVETNIPVAIGVEVEDSKGNPISQVGLTPVFTVTPTGSSPGAGSMSGDVFTGTGAGTVDLSVSEIDISGGGHYSVASNTVQVTISS